MCGGKRGLKCVEPLDMHTLPSIGSVEQTNAKLCTQSPSVQLPYVVLANSREIQPSRSGDPDGVIAAKEKQS